MFVGLGIGIGRQRVSGGSVVFDTDYQAVLNYATSLGYTLPSAGQQVKQNQLMLGLKSSGAWAKLDSVAVFATDGSSSFALIDWKRLVLLTAINSPTFVVNQGYVGNGTSASINTNYNPTTNGVNFTLNKASVWMYKFTTGTVNSGQLFSTSDDRVTITNNQTNYNLVNTNFGTLGSTPGVNFGSVTGFIGQNKTASKAGFRRRAGVNTNYTHDGADLLANNTIRLLGRTIFTNVTSSFYAAGGDLSTEVTSFETSINTYMRSL